MIDPTLPLLICLVTGAAVRVFLNLRAALRKSDGENERLRDDLKRTDGMFDAVCLELREEWVRNEVLRDELKAYREEREREASAWGAN